MPIFLHIIDELQNLYSTTLSGVWGPLL